MNDLTVFSASPGFGAFGQHAGCIRQVNNLVRIYHCLGLLGSLGPIPLTRWKFC